MRSRRKKQFKQALDAERAALATAANQLKQEPAPEPAAEEVGAA
jgi:hypothetical protein